MSNLEKYRAAREYLPIKHTAGLLGHLIGALAGAVVVAVAVVAVIALTAATAGTGTVLLCAAGGAVLGGVIGEVSFNNFVPPIETGNLKPGNTDVHINGYLAIKMGDVVGPCWTPIVHTDGMQPVIHGSKYVWINNCPASRIEDELECGAYIDGGSQNVFFGGPQVQLKGTRGFMWWLGQGLKRFGFWAMGVELVATQGASLFTSILPTYLLQMDYEFYRGVSEFAGNVLLTVNPIFWFMDKETRTNIGGIVVEFGLTYSLGKGFDKAYKVVSSGGTWSLASNKAMVTADNYSNYVSRMEKAGDTPLSEGDWYKYSKGANWISVRNFSENMEHFGFVMPGAQITYESANADYFGSEQSFDPRNPSGITEDSWEDVEK